MHKLTEDEYLLVLAMQEKLTKRQLIAAINEGRKQDNRALLPAKHPLRMKVVTSDEADPTKNPLVEHLRIKWRPTPECPLSVDYIRLYGEDYLIGYMDGYEGRDFGSSIQSRSESYIRAYVDGYKALLKSRHLRRIR